MPLHPRVFIAYRQLLLARAIEEALTRDGVEVVACEEIQPGLLDRIRAARPDVLILDRYGVAGEQALAVPEWCRDLPGLRAIVIDHGANVVEVFRLYYRQTTVVEPSDIVALVRDDVP